MMIYGDENITVKQLRDQMKAMPCKAGSEGKAIKDLVGAIMILCNRIGDLQHKLEYEKSMSAFVNGETLRDALPDMEEGTRLIYHGVLHEVIDAGEQGHRIKAVKVPGLYPEMGDPRLI